MRPPSVWETSRCASASGVSSAQVTTVAFMTLFTGACPRLWPTALSRSSRVTTPSSLPGSPTRMPLWRCCWHSTIACATVSSAETNRAGRDMISPAVSARRTALGSAASTSERASSSVPRNTADAACAWPPPPSAPASTDASSSATRVRETQNTRSPISTSATSPRASVRSTSLWTRFEIPSTYSGQATAVTSTSKPPASCVSTPATSASKSARSDAPRGVCRYWAIMSWRAPWRRHQPSASASRWVTDG